MQFLNLLTIRLATFARVFHNRYGVASCILEPSELVPTVCKDMSDCFGNAARCHSAVVSPQPAVNEPTELAVRCVAVHAVCFVFLQFFLVQEV